MPALGMSQETGRLLRWLVAEGAVVAAGQPLLEIETDKVTTEIESPAAGLLAGVRAREGEEVPVGQVIAFVLAPGESLPPVDPMKLSSREGLGAPPHVSASAPASPPGGRPAASPKARRLAQERGVDLAAVTGSGAGGEHGGGCDEGRYCASRPTTDCCRQHDVGADGRTDDPELDIRPSLLPQPGAVGPSDGGPAQALVSPDPDGHVH